MDRELWEKAVSELALDRHEKIYLIFIAATNISGSLKYSLKRPSYRKQKYQSSGQIALQQ